VIEVRSSYVVAAADIAAAIATWRDGRERIWPQLGWAGRLQQMLHGHCQQSLLVWSSTWPSLAAWEEGMHRTLDLPDYTTWSAELNRLRRYGGEREVFTTFGDAPPLDATSGRVEVRSSYLVRVGEIAQVKALMSEAQREVWPSLEWSGQNQQMLHGKASQSMFTWTSTWESLGAWEAAMGRTRDHATFQSWYPRFLAAVDVGSTREVFKNL
jgi:hypothetical protein